MAEEENMPREEISEEVPQSEPAPETEQVPEGEAPGAEAAEGAEGAQTPAEEDAAEDASAKDEEASERSSNRKKVIIGVSIVVALIVIFIIILLLLLGSCTHRHSMTHVDGVGATCETPGVIDHWHCDECDKDYLDEDGKEPIGDVTIPPISHNIVIVEYQAATCTEPGHTAGAYCADCGEVITAQEVIPALGHAFPEDGFQVQDEATCEEDGLKTCVCERCGETISEVIPALGHDPVAEEGTPATCDKDGLTGEVVCKRCHKVLEEAEVIPALGHDWGAPVVIEEAKCLFDGEQERTCERCGETVKEKIPALGHDPVSVPDVEPTCETSGVRGRVVCDRCGYPIEEGEIIPPLGHEIKDNECINCGEEACTDLEFELVTEDGTPVSYSLVGLGGCTHTHILVPDWHTENGITLPVTDVKNSAFSADLGGHQNVEQIETISFPYSILTIGANAFYKCSNLVNVTFGRGLTSIGASAFFGCTDLTSVRFLGPVSNWNVRNTGSDYDGTPVSGSLLSDSRSAAVLFKDTYASYSWWRSGAGLGIPYLS